MTEGLAAHTIGRVGEATAEILGQLGSLYQAGDSVGLTGLERALETALAGEPRGQVTFSLPGEEKRIVHTFEGSKPRDVRTTLQLSVQRAAESALEGVEKPAALAAIDVRSGDVIALVSRPLRDSLHRALVGLYPPGSTFKVVTAEALLRKGLEQETTVRCPVEARAGTARFRNFQGESFGSTSFRRAFAHSCNTAFVLETLKLGAVNLHAAAERFGFNAAYTPGLPAPRAEFPKPRDEAELAAAGIGQGRTLASPLHMASVVAAVGSGRWRAPRLYETQGDRPEIRLRGEDVRTLRALLQAVVTEGTGKSAAAVPDLVGKTGTAEYGNDKPPATHAWFVGLHRGMAFAVLVEGGGVGGQVALPIAMRFVRAGSTP